MLRNRQLPAFNGVPASLASGAKTTVTCKLPLGQRLHVLYLEFGNDGTTNIGQGLGTLDAPGMIDEIRLLIDGKVQRRMTAVELNYLNSLMGSQYAAGTSGTAGASGYRTRLPIFLAEPWRIGHANGPNGQIFLEAEMTAWNLAGIESMTIEVDLIGRTSAGVNGILDGPVIAGFYEFDNLTASSLGPIIKWSRQSFGVNATPAEITTLDRRKGAYQSIHLFPTSDHHYATSVLFTRNNEQIRQDISRFQDDLILKTRGMNPTALDTTSNATKDKTGIYNIVFDYDDRIGNMLGVADASELTLKPTYDSAPNGLQTIISQIAGPAD